MRGRKLPLAVVMMSAASFALVAFPGPASASGIVTEGNVVAILNGGTSAGAPLFHDLLGRPVIGFDDHSRAEIFPLSMPPPGANATHYCADDWHVLHMAFVNIVDNVFFFNNEQAIADLQATTLTIALDGVPQPLTRSPIRPMNAADQQRLGLPGSWFWFQAGIILPPAALSPGTHTAAIVTTDPVFGLFQDSNTFTVDASGTGICLQPIA